MSETNEFSSLLADELSACQRLFELLTSEQTAISNQDLQQLNELQPKKQSAMDELRLSAAARQQFMSENGFNELSDLLEVLNSNDPQQASQVETSWFTLKDQYDKNRDLSDSLAQAVQQAQWRTQQQLQILCGKADKSDTYGQDGRPQSQHMALGMVQA